MYNQGQQQNFNYPQQPPNYYQNNNSKPQFNNEDYPPAYQQNNNYSSNQDMTIEIDTHKNQGDDFANNGMELLGKNTRLGFIRKVYGILSVQLLITIIFCVISMTSTAFQEFQYHHYWLAILSAVFSIIIVLVLMCFRNQAKKVPTNYILLFAFTICEAYLVSFCCSSVSNKQTVLIAAILTGTITVVLTLFALFTKADYTKWYHFLSVIFITVVMVTFFCIFWRASCPVLNIIICGIMVILYGCYLVVDTQLIAGGKKYELSYDDYIIGALFLYIDIIGIFIYILSMLGNNN